MCTILTHLLAQICQITLRATDSGLKKEGMRASIPSFFKNDQSNNTETC